MLRFTSRVVRFSCTYVVLITGLFMFSESQAQLREARRVLIDAHVAVDESLQTKPEIHTIPVYAIVASQN